MEVALFDWDEANISHIALHGVTPEEVEEVLANDPSEAVLQIHDGEERYYQYGLTNEYRCLVVVTTWRSETLIRVATAYPASPALRRVCFKERGL